MAVGEIITAARINNLQSSIALILGTGSGQSGYGQTVTSLPVNNTSQTIDAASINAIYADIITARVHQVGLDDPYLSQVVNSLTGEILDDVKLIPNKNTVAEDTSFFVEEQEGVVVTSPDFYGTLKGINDYETLMTQVIADKGLLDPTQASLESAISSTRTSSWNGLIYHEVAVTFINENHRRSFFNTGSQIKFTANLSGTTGTKGSDWVGLLDNIGTISFSANNTTSSSGGTVAIGNYQLANSYQIVYTKTATTYSSNSYTIRARSDASNRILFRIEFNDLATAADPSGTSTVDENVSGRITSTLQQLRADGDVSVASPTYFNTSTLA